METVVAREPSHDSRTSRESVLRDFVHFTWRVTRGLTSATPAEGETLVRRMVEAGRISPFQGERLVRTLNARMSMSREIYERRVDESIRRAAERTRALCAQEIDGCKARVQRLEERTSRLERM